MNQLRCVCLLANVLQPQKQSEEALSLLIQNYLQDVLSGKVSRQDTKGTAHKQQTGKLSLIKLKNVRHAKDSANRLKRQAAGWEK